MRRVLVVFLWLALIIGWMLFVLTVTARAESFPDAPDPNRILAPGLFSVRVVSQNGNSNYVPGEYGVASQFQDADWYGTIGILAHDYLSGAAFYGLTPGKRVILFYQDRAEVWQIVDAFYYYPSAQVTPGMMFDRVYRGGGLVFQTCKGSGLFFAIGELERTFDR